jgi:hypothetical protein
MVGIPAASGTLTVVASTPGRLLTHGICMIIFDRTASLTLPLVLLVRTYVEVTLRATSRRATGMAMFTAVQKIVLLGAAAAADHPSGAGGAVEGAVLLPMVANNASRTSRRTSLALREHRAMP